MKNKVHGRVIFQHNMIKKFTKGFSLVEVMVFVSILGVFFITAISVSIYTLRDMRTSQNRVFATKYAQDMVEWLKSEKETNWDTFYNNATAMNGTCKQFNKADIDWVNIADCTSGPRESIGVINDLGIFTRKVTFTTNASPSVKVHVDVIWSDSRQSYSVPLDTVFVPWQ